MIYQDNIIGTDSLTAMSNSGDPFISSFLDLALKFNSKWYWIYLLLDLCGCSVNCYIPKKYWALEYTTFDEVKEELIQVGSDSIIVKHDLTKAS